jgi:hypothetical protein
MLLPRGFSGHTFGAPRGIKFPIWTVINHKGEFKKKCLPMRRIQIIPQNNMGILLGKWPCKPTVGVLQLP